MTNKIPNISNDNILQDYNNINNKFLTKKNIKTIFISLFLVFIYVLIDVIFMSGDYDITLYTTGIHGIGDAIAKILIKIKPDLAQNHIFNGCFASIFFGCVNLFLFLFIAFPKLDFKFSMNSLINTVAFVFFLFIFTFLINGDKEAPLHSLSNGFQLIKKDSGFGLSLLRVIIVSIFTSLTISLCIKTGSSTGGIDIIAKYLSIYKKKNISFYINILNYIIAIFSVIFLYIYNKQMDYISLLLTFIKLLINSFIVYLVLNKFNTQTHN